MASKATLKKMENMFKGDLPIITAEVAVKYNKENNNYIFGEVKAEVLSVNFNTKTMRIRFLSTMWSDEPVIRAEDINGEEYINKILDSMKELK